MAYMYLTIAIIAEVIATAALAKAGVFTRLLPTLLMIAGYAVSFTFLSLTLRTIPVGIAYAIWSGAGIFLISAVGAIFLGQRLDGPALIGIGLIAAGVIVVNTFSTAAHL